GGPTAWNNRNTCACWWHSCERKSIPRTRRATSSRNRGSDTASNLPALFDPAGSTWGQPPPAVRRSEAPLGGSLHMRRRTSGEQSSPGQPRAAVPTRPPTQPHPVDQLPSLQSLTSFYDLFMHFLHKLYGRNYPMLLRDHNASPGDICECKRTHADGVPSGRGIHGPFSGRLDPCWEDAFRTRGPPGGTTL